MTREEAKEALSVLKIYDNQWLREAIDMAIEALSQPIVAKCYEIEKDRIYCSPEVADKVFKALHEDTNVQNMHKGKWIECLAYNPDLDADVLYIECDQCGHRPYFSGSYRPKYCEDCGARMFKGGDSE